jgi:hypothetical protein
MADASAAFAALSEQLELLVLWPFTSFGTFSSGGVSVGSIKLEIIETNATTPWSTAQDRHKFKGSPSGRRAPLMTPTSPTWMRGRALMQHRRCSSVRENRAERTCTSRTS